MKIFVSILVLILALPLLLVVFSAPINLLWRLKIGFTELGVFFAIVSIVFSLTLFLIEGNKFIILIGFTSAVIYLLPLTSAIILSFSIKKQMESAFGEIKSDTIKVIDPAKLFGFYNHNNISIQLVSYNEHKKLDQSLDLYSNKSGKLKPCIVSVHGGAWSSGDNKMFPNFNKEMASNGFIVADVNYRLAPDPIFPAQKEDIILAINFLKAHAKELEIDTNQIFLLGRSAGGQIAAVTAFELGKEKIKGLICFYTPHDMVWGYSFPGNPLILDSRKVLRAYLGGSFDEAKDNFYASSPVHQVDFNSPPILMIHGESDEMVAYGHNLRLIDKLKTFNIPYYLLSLPYATHGFDYFHQSHSAQLSMYAVQYFLERYTK